MNKDFYIRKVMFNKNKIFNRTEYPFCLPVFDTLKKIDFKSNVTFFVGENGTGKSTLLEAIAVNYGFNPEGGSRNFNFSTLDTHSNLHGYLTLIKGVKRPQDGYFLRAESFYNVATEIDNLGKELLHSYGGQSLHKQSHGESFMSLILERFWGNGLYILDEPEAALSPLRQLSLLCRINQLVKQNSQIIIATHSPILLAFPNAEIYVLSDKGMVLTPYKETEHYYLTKDFLNSPEKMMRELMD